MDQTRILRLNKQPFKGDAVVYVMSRDQRVQDNHALLAAHSEAKEHKVALYVLFNLKHVENRAREHYSFMLEGLKEVASKLASLNIPFVLRTGEADENIKAMLKEVTAGSVYFDFSPLTGSRNLAKSIAQNFEGSAYVVDTHNIIPVWVASDKQEFAAHTMRRKVHLQLDKYLKEPAKVTKHTVSPSSNVKSVSFAEAEKFISKIPARNINVNAEPGEKAARTHLKEFIEDGLETYAMNRNDIADDQQSALSPYLHFGQMSSLRVALEAVAHVNEAPLLIKEVRMAPGGATPSKYEGMNALLEEMIVRKELSDNFCFYQKNYKSLSAGPEWARKSLDQHRSDKREFTYTREEWEKAETHDLSWNAAQNQLIKSGKMHGYMRMYWAKKMLEWSKTPEDALADCLYLNDAYSIDGGDPNGYVGMLWSMVGLHDRPWTERPVFGKIRYMNEGGLKRKYDVKAYQEKWNNS